MKIIGSYSAINHCGDGDKGLGALVLQRQACITRRISYFFYLGLRSTPYNLILCSGLSRNILTIFLKMYWKNLKAENVLIYFMNTVQNKRKSYTLFVKVIVFVHSKNQSPEYG